MPINSIYSPSSPASLSLLTAKQWFVFRAPSARRCIYSQPSFVPTQGLLSFQFTCWNWNRKKKSHWSHACNPVERRLQEPGGTMGFWKAKPKAPLGCRKTTPPIKNRWGNLWTEKERRNTTRCVHVCSAVLNFNFPGTRRPPSSCPSFHLNRQAWYCSLGAGGGAL